MEQKDKEQMWAPLGSNKKRPGNPGQMQLNGKDHYKGKGQGSRAYRFWIIAFVGQNSILPVLYGFKKIV